MDYRNASWGNSDNQGYQMRNGQPGEAPRYGNPYSNRFAELGRQGNPQEPEQTYIQARMVNSEDDILPKEIPMDGSFRLFIRSDMNRVYAKTWGKSGLPETIEYEPVKTKKEEHQNNPSGNQIQDSQLLIAIFERLVNVENQLEALRNGRQTQMTPNNGRSNEKKQNNQQKEQGGQQNG